ncbi:MAG: response regulator [Candidatus Dormibacteraceae bacterium]
MRILIVEDDPALRMIIRMVLERQDYEVVEAPHGKAALERVAENLPDGVVADMKMPIMDGLELIQRLREDASSASIPVILLSGAADLRDARESASAVLPKPFEPADLLAMLDSVLPQPG